jgi:hypothetical protein
VKTNNALPHIPQDSMEKFITLSEEQDGSETGLKMVFNGG